MSDINENEKSLNSNNIAGSVEGPENSLNKFSGPLNSGSKFVPPNLQNNATMPNSFPNAENAAPGFNNINAGNQSNFSSGGLKSSFSSGLKSTLKNNPADIINNKAILDIPVEVQIVVGTASLPVSALMALKRGSVIQLEASLGDPVSVVVNGKVIAHGELVPIENNPSRFGVRLIEVLNKQ